MMRRQARILSIALAVTFLLAVTGGQALAAADPPPPRLITVTGDAEVKVVPDEVVLTLGVETWDDHLADAKRRNDEIIKAVVKLAEDRGIPEKYIQTDYLSIEPRYRDDYEKRDFIGYVVRKSLVITLKDLSAFEDVLSDALEAGVTHVQGIQFRTTELRKYRDEARALAIQAAREKATALSGELGQEIGDPHSIQEEPSWWWSWYDTWWGGRYGGAMTQNVTQNSGGTPPQTEGAIAPGQISVSARVTVSFELK